MPEQGAVNLHRRAIRIGKENDLFVLLIWNVASPTVRLKLPPPWLNC